MNSILQFHAAPEELLALAKWICATQPMTIAAEWFAPPERKEISEQALDAAFERPDLVKLRFVPKCVSEKAERGVVLILFRPVNGELRQSSIGINSTNASVLNSWRQIQKHIRATTRSGAIVTMEAGSSAVSRVARYTKGAEALSREGVRMKAAGGTATYRFPDS